VSAPPALAVAGHKQFIRFPTDCGFLILHHELPVFPLISERGAPIDGLAELGAGKDGAFTRSVISSLPLGNAKQVKNIRPPAVDVSMARKGK